MIPMKVLFFVALAAAILWTGFVVFANGMKTSDMGGFLGGGTLVVAWLVVAIIGAIGFAG